MLLSSLSLFRVMLIILLYIGLPLHTYADEDSQFHLDVTQSIVYCDITPSFNQKDVIQDLKEGTEVSFYWHIEVESIESYWFNQQIADIYFKRQVIPDLLTQQWQLHDSLTDIPTRTHTLLQALSFLSHIERFPILDKSLLAPDADYIIKVSLSIEKGQQNHSWWDTIFNREHTVATSILHRP